VDSRYPQKKKRKKSSNVLVTSSDDKGKGGGAGGGEPRKHLSKILVRSWVALREPGRYFIKNPCKLVDFSTK
jgi:hypothetical protein